MGYQRCVRCAGEGEVVESGFQMTCPDCKGFRVVTVKAVPAKARKKLVDASNLNERLAQAQEKAAKQRAAQKMAAQISTAQRVAKRIKTPGPGPTPAEISLGELGLHDINIGQSLALKAFEGFPLSPEEETLLSSLYADTRSNVEPRQLRGRLPFKTLIYNAARQSGKSTLLGHYLKWFLEQAVHQDVRRFLPEGQARLEILVLRGVMGRDPLAELRESRALRPHLKGGRSTGTRPFMELATSGDLDRKAPPSIRVQAAINPSSDLESLRGWSPRANLLLVDELVVKQSKPELHLQGLLAPKARIIMAGTYNEGRVPQAFDEAFDHLQETQEAQVLEEALGRLAGAQDNDLWDPDTLVISPHTHEARGHVVGNERWRALSWKDRVRYKASKAEVQVWVEALEEEGLSPSRIEALLAKVGKNGFTPDR